MKLVRFNRSQLTPGRAIAILGLTLTLWMVFPDLSESAPEASPSETTASGPDAVAPSLSAELNPDYVAPETQTQTPLPPLAWDLPTLLDQSDQRNPFLPVDLPTEKPTDAETGFPTRMADDAVRPVPAAQTTEKPLLLPKETTSRLHLIYEGRRRIAVIDEQVIVEGQAVGGAVVEEISTGSVKLQYSPNNGVSIHYSGSQSRSTAPASSNRRIPSGEPPTGTPVGTTLPPDGNRH